MKKTRSNPKYITHKKGDKLPVGFKKIFQKAFSNEEIEGFKRDGVRIRLSAQSPFPKPRPPKKEVVIKAECLKEIKDAAHDAKKLEKILAKFKGTELRKIGMELRGLKFSAKEKVEAVRAMVFESLRSEFVWKAIAGENSGENDQ